MKQEKNKDNKCNEELMMKWVTDRGQRGETRNMYNILGRKEETGRTRYIQDDNIKWILEKQFVLKI
jgi:hypothetical protein